MKDAKGHGSNGRGAAASAPAQPAPAAHQAGVHEATNPTLAEGRDLYAALSSAAYMAHPDYRSGLDARSLSAMDSTGTHDGD